jgi:RNA polymerase sigma-70 factor (ECF subfamily)
MHVALWRSLASFDGRCSMRTWVYRVAHNVAASHIDKERRGRIGSVTIEEIEQLADIHSLSADIEQSDAIEKLNALIRKLPATDRQVLTLYLEDLDAASIAEITGLTPGGVATRISRLKAQLAKSFQEHANV